jgi:ABC-type phosphate transport system substrate-binding protein
MKQLLLSILAVLAFLAADAPAQVAVVANPSVEAQPLDARTLLDMYTGAIKNWNGGTPIVLVDQKERTDIRTAFYRYLGMSASRLKSIWMKNLLAGEGSPPEAISTEEELLQRVASTPGALGYASLDKARAADGVIILLEIPEEGK